MKDLSFGTIESFQRLSMKWIKHEAIVYLGMQMNSKENTKYWDDENHPPIDWFFPHESEQKIVEINYIFGLLFNKVPVTAHLQEKKNLQTIFS